MAEGRRPNVVFVGVKPSIAHASLHWWEASRGDQPRREEEPRADVFGVRRPWPAIAPAPAGAAAGGLWKTLLPRELGHAHTAADTAAFVCSGVDDSHRRMALEAARAGKAVFVESLERFSAADVAELAAAAADPVGAAPPAPLMAGLYLRFDPGLWAAARPSGGLRTRVGAPVLYQARASTPNGSLFDLGMEQVDALRLLLGSEPVEVHCMGLPSAAAPIITIADSEAGDADQVAEAGEAAAAPGTPGRRPWFTGAAGPGLGAPASELGGCAALALSLRMEAGALASISLVRGGAGAGAARLSVLVVGEHGQAELSLRADVEELQKAGVSHFLECVLAPGDVAPRATPRDVYCAHAVMAAAARSLASGKPVNVAYDSLEALAGRAAAVVGGAADRAAAAVHDVAAALAAAPGKLASAAAGALGSPPATPAGGAAGADARGASVPLLTEEDSQGVGTPPHSGIKEGGERLAFHRLPEAPAMGPLDPHVRVATLSQSGELR